MNANSLPLFGKTVVITRAAHQASHFARALEESGAAIEFFPTIRIEPEENTEQCSRAIREIGAYDGIIFTSANGAEHFLQRFFVETTPSGKDLLKGKQIFVIGEKTKMAVEAFGLHAATPEKSRSARELAEALGRMSEAKRRFLFPKGNLSGTEVADILGKHGLEVDEVTVYRTLPPLEGDAARLKEKFLASSIDVVTFFSPSSIRNFLEIFRRRSLGKARIAVIGETTAAEAKMQGLENPLVAREATSESLAETITHFFRNHEQEKQ